MDGLGGLGIQDDALAIRAEVLQQSGEESARAEAGVGAGVLKHRVYRLLPFMSWRGNIEITCGMKRRSQIRAIRAIN